MKKLFLLMFASSLAMFGCAQKKSEKGVPEPVTNAFTQKYPTAKEVKWEKENDLFEVNFDLNETDYSVLYDANGRCIETEVAVEQNQLPEKAINYLKTNYPEKKVKETATITTADGVLTYEAEINGIDVLFDSSGTFLKEAK